MTTEKLGLLELNDSTIPPPPIKYRDSAYGDDQSLLVDIAQAVLARADASEWRINFWDVWCMLRPVEYQTPGQGWKLHVSATPLSAPLVLKRVAEVLVREECAFKFARDLDQLAFLVSNRCERGSGGKFITVYPQDDEMFRRLAVELDRVTDGLPGPKILSDRQLRPGSIVYYRYGVIGNQRVFTDRGRFESMLLDPDGQPVNDERPPVFTAPEWATLPLPDQRPIGMSTDASVAPEVLVAGRFAVKAAIRHSYRGGVYRAIDQETGIEVVLKQARPHALS